MKPRFEIIPAILVKTAEEAKEKLRVAQQCSPWIQLDVMDGKFVPNTTWYAAKMVRTWTIRGHLELHLMVNDPRRVIEEWKTIPKCKRFIWHIEAPINHQALIDDVHDMGKEVGLAISPKTSLMELAAYLDRIDTVLVMGVEPGFGGQDLLPETAQRITQIHKMNPDLPIAVDGGVNEKTIIPLAKAGATRLAMNSAIYNHAFPRDFVAGQLQHLERLVQ